MTEQLPRADRPVTSAHDAAVERLRALIRIPTISRTDESSTEWARFDEFLATLAELYPAAHRVLERELIDGHSALYRWDGTDPGEPAVLMAHYDVVHADGEGWEHGPFSADLVGDGDARVVWGRGTLDDKGQLAAIMEALEHHAARGTRPRHDVYLSFGHNEETAGSGARVVVDTLEARGVRPRFVLDEGGAIVEGIFPGVSEPIAVIGVSEKGILDLQLTVQQEGGHASTPPQFTATARLARALVRLTKRPFPKRFTDTNFEMMRTLGARATGFYRFLFTNLWLTRGLLLWLYPKLGDETNAIVRTTGAITQLEGAVSSNALAERARATVNIRIAAGSSIAESVEHVRRAVRDEKVALTVLHGSEPSPVSPTTGDEWNLLKDTILEVYPGTIVTPYVMLGASDSRHFTRVSDRVYRFSPFEMSKEERGTLHAVNERIRVSTYLSGIDFYRRLLAQL